MHFKSAHVTMLVSSWIEYVEGVESYQYALQSSYLVRLSAV